MKQLFNIIFTEILLVTQQYQYLNLKEIRNYQSQKIEVNKSCRMTVNEFNTKVKTKVTGKRVKCLNMTTYYYK